MKALLRDTDTIVELAENNYLFLLPFTGHENIPTVKEKIEKNLLPGEDKKHIICAVACFPEHGENADALIESLETSFKLEQSNC